MALTDEEYIKHLKSLVDKYKEENGNFNVPVKKLPFYHVASTISLRPSFKEKGLTAVDILHAVGVPEDVYKPQMGYITIDVLKQKMDEFVRQGNDIYRTSVKKTPFYYAIESLKRRPEYSGYDTDDFYVLCGYPPYRGFSVTELNEKLAKIADADGYVDAIKTHKKGELKNIGNVVARQAKNFGCIPAVFILATTDYRYKDVIDRVDFIEFVRLEICKNYEKGSDLYGIANNDKKNYDRLRRVAMCTATSIQEVAHRYGFTYMEAKADYSNIDTDNFENYFLERFPNRKIPSLMDFPNEHKYAVSCARKLNKTVKELFEEKGFEYVGCVFKKLYRAHVDFSEDEQFILKAKKFYYSKSEILNNPNSIPSQIDKEKLEILQQILEAYNKWKIENGKMQNISEPEMGE